MAKIWSDIVLPIAVAGAVAAQTVGVEVNRARRLQAWFPQRDTVTAVMPDSTLVQKDTVLKSLTDTTVAKLEDEEEFDLFAEADDTLPKVFARDTMKVPDSLRITDPFLYQWYVATKDGYTHKLVVDSLKAEGDSLIWPRIDSLYLADSTLAAKLAWEREFAAMSKAEQKRWIYEHVELPKILHRQDSIFRRKDSLQHIKDSIRQNTPRILETAFLPDSLYYKRLVSWKHNRLWNSIETFQWDTTANYHFYDYPFMRKDVGASWLGMPGSAVQQYNWFKRDDETSTSFYAPMESWTYTPDNLPQFNTKTPYTELEYFGNLFNNSTLSADNFRVFTTQNILPELNIALEMKRYGGAGTLRNEETNNRTYFVAGNYIGKKYLAHAGFIYNKSTRQESGGVQDNMWVRDTTVDVREIEVNLATATNRYKKISFFLDQSYRIPFEFLEKLKHRGDTTWVPADTLNKDIMTGFIGTSSEYTTYSKKYVDNTSTALSAFYRDAFYINPNKSTDSLRTSRLENRIFVRLQPWKEDAIVSKLEGGIGHRFQTFYLQAPNEVLYKAANNRWNSFYAYAGAEGKLSKYFNWDATGLFNFAGHEAGDFYVKANAAISFYPFRRAKQSPITLGAHFETSLKEPDFYQQHFYSNHFKWENNFGKTSTTRINATLDIPKWRLKAQAGYALIKGLNYYDTLGVARQNTSAMSVLMAGISHHLVLGPLHLENSALFQVSSAQDILPLPTLALNLRYYFQFNIVNPKVLQMQIGINTRFTTKWYAPWYNPVSGTFALQTETQYGEVPVTDIFINMQWKKCCLFLKFENAGRGWPSRAHDYFTAHHYIQTAPMLKFGISWPFYPRLGAARTMSARAGSGFSGGGGASNGRSTNATGGSNSSSSRGSSSGSSRSISR
ncbi:MAG: putative porin [Bacteroidales bacterium]|nr:putative porin [Bacteroidales bacterium]